MDNNTLTGTYFSPQESADIREWFGMPPEQIDADTLKKTLRELRARFHPDNFEKFGDATVKQLATDRFQRIEQLAEKLQAWMEGKLPQTPAASNPAGAVFGPDARFAYQSMKIEIRTGDKDLKYHLFGSFYRWLTLGEKFKIPQAGNAWLIADEEYRGRNIGFQETIRFYLTFDENDPVDAIVDWLWQKIEGRADALLIEGEPVASSHEAILLNIKQRSYRRLAAAND